MRLFSEEVTPTFTSSNLNILTVKEFVEVFFDVYEFEINGKKFIAEKVDTHDGYPVVSVPVVFEGKEEEHSFILLQGTPGVLFNKEEKVIVEKLEKEEDLPLSIELPIEDEIEELPLLGAKSSVLL